MQKVVNTNHFNLNQQYQLTAFVLIILTISSCFSKKSNTDNAAAGKSDPGSYLAYTNRSKPNEYYRVPGMVYVPTGSMLVGANDDGVFGNFFALKNRQVTINGFWMDESEVTNDMYKGFVSYVHDYTVANLLGVYVQQGEEKGKQKVAAPEAKNAKATKASGRRAVKLNSANQSIPSPAAATNNNDAQRSGKDSIPDLARVTIALQDIKNLQKLRDSGIYYYNSIEKTYFPNYNNIKYAYYQFSLSEISNSKQEFSEKELSSSYKFKNLAIFPDTTVWVKEISYSYNEPMAMRYFSSVNYRQYPVVGVNWYQALAYCDWKTKQTRQFIEQNPRLSNLVFDAYFRLPTESEWEYAARGGRSNTLYPWGGPYTSNKLGCFLANFKNQRGVYTEDGYAYTCDVKSYWPNDFGLYNMAGNVSEWTASIYTNDAYVYISDINPSLSDVDLNIVGNLSKEEKQIMAEKKVIKGGSWKDVAAFIQNGYRTYETASDPKSYIGFRTVIDLPPTSF